MGHPNGLLEHPEYRVLLVSSYSYCVTVVYFSSTRRVPVSTNQSLTYIFVPKDLVQLLFGELNIQMPEIAPVNLTKTLNGDIINITVDPSSIAAIGSRLFLSPQFPQYRNLPYRAIAKFSNNGVGHSLFTSPVDMGM